MLAGPPDGQVPHELLDPSDPDLRAPRPRAGGGRHRRSARCSPTRRSSSAWVWRTARFSCSPCSWCWSASSSCRSGSWARCSSAPITSPSGSPSTRFERSSPEGDHDSHRPPGARRVSWPRPPRRRRLRGGSSSSTSSSSQTPADFDFGDNNPRKVTAFGDSITRGVLELRRRDFGLSTSNNYPDLLQGKLRGLDPAWLVVNRGVGRRGDRGGRAPDCAGPSAVDKPGFVLIMEGTNDASRCWTLRHAANNLRGMVQIAKANNVDPDHRDGPAELPDTIPAPDAVHRESTTRSAPSRTRRTSRWRRSTTA